MLSELDEDLHLFAFSGQGKLGTDFTLNHINSHVAQLSPLSLTFPPKDDAACSGNPLDFSIVIVSASPASPLDVSALATNRLYSLISLLSLAILLGLV